MATSDKLQKLIDTKESIRQAINQKGGNITTSEPFASYPEYIKNLQTIKQGDYEHNPSAFERIGYTTFPFAATELIDHSEEYRDIVEGNNNNVLIQDKELIYFPVIELNESIDTVTFSASNTSTGVFNTNFPSATVFPPIDFKGRNINAGGSYGIFYNSKNLVEAYLNNAVLNNIQYLFSGCSALIKAEIKDCSSLNGSFARMFYDCSNLKYVTFDNLDTSNATSLTYLFYRCTELINVKGIEDFKTSNVTDMSYTFSQSSYEGNIDLHKWDVSKVTTFRQFISEVNVSNKPSFTSIDLSGWNLEAFNPSTTTSFQIVDGSLKYLDCSDWNLPSATTIPCLVTKADVECELNCPNWNLPKVATLSAATSNTTFQCLDGYYNNIGTGIKRINCSGW